MSQAKVDRYKEEKRNREKLMKKEKRQTALIKLGGVLVAIVLIGWVGYSVYGSFIKGNIPAKTYSVDAASLDDFMNNLPEETEAGTEAETEAVSE